MNIQTLHTFMMSQFREIETPAEGIFMDARTRASAGRKINVKTFVDQLKTALKPYRVNVQANKEHYFKGTGPSQQWYPLLSGVCYEPTENSQKVAKIDLIIGIDASSSRLELTEEGWDFFKYRFFKTMKHELVHRAQYANGRRGDNFLVFRPHSHASHDKYHYIEQQYLGEIDEIEAYAHDCVEEWYCLHPTRPLTLKLLREDFSGPRRLPSLSYYYDVFHGDEFHAAVQRLFRKVKAWNDLMVPMSASLVQKSGRRRLVLD